MELLLSVGIYALGAFVFTILTKVAIEIELGRIGKHKNINQGVGNAGESEEKIVAEPAAVVVQ